jgi:bifunctional ADP-heptose synthase (sugar kinase/adenylyltransferase)
LRRALAAMRGVRLDYFLHTPERRTFTYCKPLVLEAGQPPRELNRLDTKNWTATPAAVEERFVEAVDRLFKTASAFIVLSQVDIPETGVVTNRVLEAFRLLAEDEPRLTIIADSRRGLAGFPPVSFKMNVAELGRLVGDLGGRDLEAVKAAASKLARQNRRHVFVTLDERGILGASPKGEVEHVPALPLRGPIDIVGAGDAVTANLTTTLAVGATLREALEIANAAASVVIHQLGTTGTASVDQIREVLFPESGSR